MKNNMTPNPYKPTETQEQQAVVEWCDFMKIPIVHIPNEGKRSAYYGQQLKRAGMRKGFPDLFIPLACGSYHGLFVEMKVGRNKTTEDQERWLSLLCVNGYKTCVCYGYDEAVTEIKKYIREV